MFSIQRKLLITLLAVGTVAGFGAGFASLKHRSCARRASFEQHVADVCVEAARRHQGDRDQRDFGPPPPDAR
jgi:hypothetical protein